MVLGTTHLLRIVIVKIFCVRAVLVHVILLSKRLLKLVEEVLFLRFDINVSVENWFELKCPLIQLAQNGKHKLRCEYIA